MNIKTDNITRIMCESTCEENVSIKLSLSLTEMYISLSNKFTQHAASKSATMQFFNCYIDDVVFPGAIKAWD